MSDPTKTYTLAAEYTENGRVLDTTSEESLGEFFGNFFGDIEAAKEARSMAQDELKGIDGYEGVRITVEEL